MNDITLIIGCGNNYKNHNKIHDKNSFTIDQNKALEPSLVCCLGKDLINTDKSFSKIIFEGVFPIAINTLIGVNELSRISNDMIDIQVTIIEDDNIIILSERKNFKSKYISSFLLFQMTHESETSIRKINF